APGVALEPERKLVVVGGTAVGGAAAVSLLNPMASLDATFDGDGARGLDSGGHEEATGVALQPDGKIVVVGWTTVGDDGVVYRLNPNGTLDTTFDHDGAVGIDSGGEDSATAVALQPDGRIVVAGTTTLGFGNATVTRLNPNGSPDNGFGGDGQIGLDSGGDEVAHAVAIQPNGKIVVAGHSTD